MIENRSEPLDIDASDHCATCHARLPEEPIEHDWQESYCSESCAAGNPPETWACVWDNGDACDTLGTFETEAEARAAGEHWLWEMIAIDPDPARAAEAYSFEVYRRTGPSA